MTIYTKLYGTVDSFSSHNIMLYLHRPSFMPRETTALPGTIFSCYPLTMELL